MRLLPVLLAVGAFLTGRGKAANSKFSPARPPALPLAVRSPYMSTWLAAGSNGGNGGYLPGEWPTFWTGQVTAWTGVIKVDGLTYIWMGAPVLNAPLVSQTSYVYTSTRSTFTLNVDNAVGMIVEFLSPVLPNDTVRSSLAASYMNVQVYSLDGRSHDVQLYTDISAEWTSGNRNDIAQWTYGVAPISPVAKRDDDAAAVDAEAAATTRSHRTFGTKTNFVPTEPPKPTTSAFSKYSWTPHDYPTHAVKIATTKVVKPKATASPKPGIAYHQVYRQTPLLFTEASDQAQWGNWYYATSNIANLTYQSGQDAVVRGQFFNTGFLANTQDTNYRAINDDYPVFGYAIDLGTITTKKVSTLFTINLMQEEVILYENGITNTNQSLAGLWTKYWNSELDAVTYFYNDFATAGKLCTTLDNRVKKDATAAAGANYYLIAALAVRQAFGGLQLAANGTGNDFYVFMKEISSDGNIQTVDVIYPLHSILIYMNPTWLQLLLEPLMINQEAGYWPYQYSIHDLGNTYPNATGHNNGQDESQPLEECGNMVIMALAYAQRANDNAWLSRHYDILRQWNEYLVEEALIPMFQISTDDFAGALANQTNLAIKGIIGIAAMGEIANRTGNAVDGLNYTEIAQSYVNQWQSLAIAYDASPPHTTLDYGDNSSFSLLYNLYADRELNLGLVPQSVYDMQSAFYPTVENQYGVPLDTRHTYTKLDWQLLCAAIADASTQALMISKLAYWINNTPSDVPLSDWYETVSGTYDYFIARPVVGALFGILALQSAPATPALG